MNFNKDYPIAILDTNIVMDVPNILNILKGCNIVIPYTLIDELDKVKKENAYGVRNFVNNFLALSEKANLSKDGYKLENDCMLYLDIDKNNSYHKDINLDSKNQDIKFIAEAKNLKEKYNDMEVVLISSDKIMKITASIFDVKVKNLEEFIMEYFKLDINELYEFAENSNLSHSYKETIYKVILQILSDNKDIDGLYELASKNLPIREIKGNILYTIKSGNIYMLGYIYNKIFDILVENKDIGGLYELKISASRESLPDLSKEIDYKIRELKNNK